MTYTHLSPSERYQIERWLQQGLRIIQIARLLNRAKSTIYRELSRSDMAYSAAGAVIHRHQCASRSAANAPRVNALAWQAVKQRLNQRWSPQQIAGRARYLGQACPSWQAIYGWIGRTWLKPGSNLQSVLCDVGTRVAVTLAGLIKPRRLPNDLRKWPAVQ